VDKHCHNCAKEVFTSNLLQFVESRKNNGIRKTSMLLTEVALTSMLLTEVALKLVVSYINKCKTCVTEVSLPSRGNSGRTQIIVR